MTGVLVWLSVGVYFGLVFGLACDLRGRQHPGGGPMKRFWRWLWYVPPAGPDYDGTGI